MSVSVCVCVCVLYQNLVIRVIEIARLILEKFLKEMC
jgi:hypothetical protein